MSDKIGALLLSFLIGVAGAIGLYWLGGFSSAGSIFLGGILTIVIGSFLNWALFRPLPEIENGRLKVVLPDPAKSEIKQKVAKTTVKKTTVKKAPAGKKAPQKKG